MNHEFSKFGHLHDPCDQKVQVFIAEKVFKSFQSELTHGRFVNSQQSPRFHLFFYKNPCLFEQKPYNKAFDHVEIQDF